MSANCWMGTAELGGFVGIAAHEGHRPQCSIRGKGFLQEANERTEVFAHLPDDRHRACEPVRCALGGHGDGGRKHVRRQRQIYGADNPELFLDEWEEVLLPGCAGVRVGRWWQISARVLVHHGKVQVAVHELCGHSETEASEVLEVVLDKRRQRPGAVVRIPPPELLLVLHRCEPELHFISDAHDSLRQAT